MEIGRDDIIAGVISAVIGGLIVRFIPQKITNTDPFTIINNPTAQFILIFIAVYLILSSIAARIRHRINRRSPTIHTVERRWVPNHVDRIVELDKFGVVWPVKYGRRTTTGDRYAYAENPRCPDCNADLTEDSKEKRIGDDAEIWRCGRCGFTQERPDTWLHDEKEAVENDVESRIRNNEI